MGIFGWSLPPGCGTLPGEEVGAVEEKIDGIWYAWDEADRVHKYEPNHPDARDDGFVYIGQIVWPESMGPEEEPKALLVEFVRNLKEKQNGICI